MTDKQIAAYCDDVKETALKQFYKIQNQRKEISILHKKCVCRQREIETLKAEAKKYYNAAKIQQDVSMKRFFEIKRLKEDNERLKRLFAEEEAKYNECAKRFYKEAIKEFAERLKENTREFGSANGIQREIDNLVKEMVGDADV